ncbi:hypothetical protein H2198_007194 [Neophaeococcomyces mojaviensis]|uniref:Uncharacterized protein n=1 Tax=Neophaeococcomyces mojaviensis TaxID=3383035 RepID=A0ACC3A0X5_9EURO|nr:hypothetical protein H2198_007194 [Knufia sp. JES_112]
MTPPRPLCFRHVHQHVPEEEWMWHLVQHMRGVRHKSLCQPKLEFMTPRVDPIGHSVAQIALINDYEPLDESEAQLYEKLLVDTLHGNLEVVKVSFDDVRNLRKPYLNPVQPVATVGAFKGHLQILEFAMEMGAEMNRDVAFAVQKGSNSTSEMATYYEANKEKLDKLIEIPLDPAKVAAQKVSDEQRQKIDELIRR